MAEKQQTQMSRTVVNADVTLYTLEAQRIFKRFYNRTDFALMWLDEIYDRITAVEEFAGIFKQIDTRIADCFNEIALRREQIAELLTEQGVSDINVTHEEPKTLNANIQHPTSMKLKRLIESYDEFMKDIHTLWLIGLFNRAQRKEASAQIRAKITDICVQTIQTNGTAQKLYKRAKKEGGSVNKLLSQEEDPPLTEQELELNTAQAAGTTN